MEHASFLQEMDWGFESLDYDVVESSLNKVYLHHQTHSGRRNHEMSRWLCMMVIGLLTGLVAAVMGFSVKALFSFRFSLSRHYLHRNLHPDGAGELPPWADMVMAYSVFLVLALAYVLVAVLLVALVEPVSAGSGIPEIKGYLNGCNFQRVLRVKTMVCKVIGVVFAVAGGLVLGKEGPLVHTGASIAANVSHLPQLPRIIGKRWLKRFRSDRHKRDFVSAGAAAGVAAAFGAPMGGVLFALEEASSFWSLSLTWMVFFCAMCSTFMLNLLQSAKNNSMAHIDSPGLITFGTWSSMDNQAYESWELPFFLLMGVVGGLLGGLFNSLNIRLCRWRKRVRREAWKMVLEALLVGMLTATVQFWLPAMYHKCVGQPSDSECSGSSANCLYVRYTCPEKQFNPMATAVFATSEDSIKGLFHNHAHYGTEVMVIFLVVYFCLALVTYGVAVPSGLFVPGILIGCGYGRMIGEAVNTAFGHGTVNPGIYAFIGASSMLGGMSRMTISLTIILVETTNNMLYLLPVMVVLMISKWVGDCFNISLYDLHLQLKGIPFVEAEPERHQEFLAACHVMHSPVLCFKEKETAGNLLRLLRSCQHNGFPVITQHDEYYVGLITRNEIALLLRKIAGLHPGEWKNTPRAAKGLINRSHKITQAHGSGSDNHFTQDYLGLLSNLNGPGAELQSDVDPSHLAGQAGLPADVLKYVHPLDFTTSLSSTVDKLDDLELNSAQEQVEVDLRPFMNPVPLSVQEVCPVTRVFRVFRGLGLRHLVVVDVENHVVGMISRAELSHAQIDKVEKECSKDPTAAVRDRSNSGRGHNADLKEMLMMQDDDE